MKKKNQLDLSLFTQRISPPENRSTVLCVNILADGKFNMNGKLSEKLGGKALEILFTDSGRNFLIAEKGEMEMPITFPKSGSRKLPVIADMLKRQKISLPAKYEVWQRDDGYWQGDFLENPTVSQSVKPHNSKWK